MPRVLFINDPEDIQWLLDVHLSGRDIPDFLSAVIIGNEDSPEIIELYSKVNPHFEDAPILSIDFGTEE